MATEAETTYVSKDEFLSAVSMELQTASAHGAAIAYDLGKGLILVDDQPLQSIPDARTFQRL